jgi:hypothetical protein
MRPRRGRVVGVAGVMLGFLGCARSAAPVPSGAAGAGTTSGSADESAEAGNGVEATTGIAGDATRSESDAPGSVVVDTGSGSASANNDFGDDAETSTGVGPEAASQDTGTNDCAGLFCEDFEQGQIDPSKWDVMTGAGGTLNIEEQTVAHGKYAMHVHGLAGPADYALIVTKNAPAALSKAPFGRAYFFITPKPTSGHTQMTFAGTNGPGPAEGPGPLPKLRYMEVANIGGGWQIGFDLLDVSPLIEEVAYPAGSPQVPVTTWTCLEWQFTDQPDVVNLWVDGAAVGTFDDEHVSYPGGHTPGMPLYDGTSSGLIGGYTVFGFGFHDWHPNEAFDLYYDDIILDTRRVGCVASGDP